MGQSLEGADPRLVAGYMQLSQVCNIKLESGVRTREEQQALWDNRANNPYPVAAPGTSRHETGRAIDISGDLACAHREGPAFGLVFPYSDDPIHMEVAGGEDGPAPVYTGASGDQPHVAPKANPVPRILAAVSSALDPGAGKSGIEQLGADLGEKPAAALEAGTAVPGAAGPISGNSIYEMILSGIGAPVSDENMRLLDAWARAEGMPSESNNPLATTEGNTPGVVGTHNSVGVKLYDSPQSGAQAIVKTLLNGRYNHIVDAMRANDLTNAAIGIENSPWGTGGLVRKILGV